MKEKTICVFCGREEEQGILSGGHFVTYSGLSCLRCGGPMKYGKRTALQLAEMGTGDLSHLSSGVLKVSVQYCAHCGRLEFFQSDFHREEGESDEGRDQQ